MAWRTGYFYGGGFGGLSVGNVPYSDYTHILYESISPNGGGGIDTLPVNLGELATFVANCHSAGAKALICLGVADAGSWQGSTNPGNVASFASAVASFVSAQNLDGVDLDWESGINVSQYADFIRRLRGALGSSKIISIAAYGGGGSSPKAAVAAAGASYLDQVNLMSYDMGIYEARSWYNTAIHTGPNGEWSIEATLFEFTAAGIPVSKLGIGIPFYGLSFSGDTAAGQSNTYSGSPAYSNINTSGSTYDATYGGESVVSGGSWTTYAGPTLISAIVSYGSGAGVGGYMAFPLNWEGSSHPLSTSLASATGSSTPTVPSIYSFAANPTTVTSGAASVLSWSTSGSTSLSIDNGIGTVTGSTTHTVNPTVTTTYILTATNTQGSVTHTATVTIGSGAPSIQSFTASPASFVAGASVTLSWSTSLSTSLSINNGVGTVTGASSVIVTPGVTTTYTLTATNGSGTVTATATATAGSTAAQGAPALPVIQSFTPGSTSITQGTSTTLSFAVLGAGAKGITITPDIGVVSGSSVTVAPLTTTTYTITAQNGAGAVSQSVQIVVHGSVGENIRVHQIRRDERHGDYQILQASDGTGIVDHLAGYNLDGSLTDTTISATDVRNAITTISNGTVLIGSGGSGGVFPVGSWYGQVPRGPKNGSNNVFYLDYDLGSPFTILMGNGVGQLPSVDGPHLGAWYLPGAQYSITGNVLTMLSAPSASEWLYIWYFIANPHAASTTYSALHTITIDHSQVSADLADFVFTFTGSYAFLKAAGSGGTMQSASAYDVVFSLDTAGTVLLDYQRVTHNLTSGKVEYKIRIPALSFSFNTVIYVLSGSTAVTTNQSNVTGAWGSGYLEVFHFGDGTTLNLVGSIAGTVAINHGATATAGDFGGAASFNGNGDAGDPGGAAWIDLGNPFNSSTLTLEVFGVATNFHSGNTMASNISGGSGYQIGQPAASPWQAKLNSSSYNFPTPGGVYNPYYQAFTIDGSTAHLFSGDQGGNTMQSSYSAGSPSLSVSNLLLGRTPGSGTNLFLGGFIEEVRISSVVRTYERYETTRKNVFHRDANLVGQPVFYTVT